MAVAAFDLDDTLLNGDSDSSWRLFMAEQRLLDPEVQRVKSSEYDRAYRQGTLDVEASSCFSIAPVVGLPPERLSELLELFVEQKLLPMIQQSALDLVARHRDRNDDLVIITGTNRLVAAKAAELFAIPELLATEIDWQDDRITGKLSGVPCYMQEKVVRFRIWLDRKGLNAEQAFFYSDSHNDLPLLRLIDNPVAVNPDPQLRTEAQRLGWPIMDLSHASVSS
ncbi:MAG: HAD family hydrolase [Gammaproteobacteria bacterium]